MFNNPASNVLIQRFSWTGGSRASVSSTLELVTHYMGLPSKSPRFWTRFNAWAVDSSSRVTTSLPSLDKDQETKDTLGTKPPAKRTTHPRDCPRRSTMLNFSVPMIEGFLLSAGLIVGIGPRNTLILRQGLRRQHLWMIVLLCTLVDAILIGLGTVGAGAFIQSEWLIKLMTYAGVAALLFYGVCSFRAAFSPALAAKEALTVPTRRQIVMALLTVNFLNPNLYIDTMLLIGGGASRYGHDQRLWFAVGAIAASLVWFLVLGYGSALLAPFLRQPKVLRGIDLFSGALLWFMAFRLASHLG